MSRHEGVSCDSCLKSNFRGRRYKCLVCFDYDLCSNCYESGVTTTRHTSAHSMQCILTRADHELFYGGDGAGGGGGGGHHHHHHHLSSMGGSTLAVESTMSYACPFCPKLGFTEATLVEHVSSQHSDAGHEVVCPICASLPGGDPNHVTDDFSAHLALEHRAGPRDLISFLDSPGAGHAGGGSGASLTRPLGVRRMPHASRGTARARRAANAHGGNGGSGTAPSMQGPSGLSTLTPSAAAAAAAAATRDSTVDPIAELLSQLSGVRRSTASGSSSSSSSQLQQLQMQLQMERQQAQRHAVDQRLGSSSAPRTRTAGLSFGAGRAAAAADLGFQPHPGSLSQQAQQDNKARQSLTSAVAQGGAALNESRGGGGSVGVNSSAAAAGLGLSAGAPATAASSRFLLRQSSEEEDTSSSDDGEAEVSLTRARRRGLLVQDLVLSTMTRGTTTRDQYRGSSSGFGGASSA